MGRVDCSAQSVSGFNQGFFNPVLYLRLGPQLALNDITIGNNGAYQAGLDWDACTGWGSPNGQLIANKLGLPTVTSVQPPGGAIGQTTQVTISGTCFASASAVLFDNTPATFNPLDANNTDTQISAQSPQVNTAGIVRVKVVTTAGTSLANPPLDQFENFFPVQMSSHPAV
jgi:hypothetical protein